jgi:MFS family permease
VYTFFAFAGRSVWSQSVLASFVFLLTQSSPKVGYSTAVLGMTQLVVSVPSGWYTDVTGRRDGILRVAAWVGLAAACVTLYACCIMDPPSYECLLVALAAWGAFWGMANTSVMALFADAIPDGQRAHYFTRRSIVTLAGNTFGPLVSLVMFVFLGDTWTLPECALVIALGQVFFLPALVLSMYFNDDDNDIRRREASEEENRQDDESEQPFLRLEEDSNDIDEEDGRICDGMSVVSSPNRRGDSSSNTSSDDDNDDDDDGSSRGQRRLPRLQCLASCFPQDRTIPYLIATGDVVSGLGAGMSIQHLPIFLMDQLRLRPVQVQALSVISPLVMAALMHVAQRVATRHGRCRVSLAFKWVGIAFMLLLIVSYNLRVPTWLICVIYVVRSGFMNSTSALTRSVLMDHVPSCERGKWSAVESINMFSWSGSAAIGGLIIAKMGSLLPLFGITALVQFAASLCLLPLLDVDDDNDPSVAGEDDSEENDRDDGTQAGAPRARRLRESDNQRKAAKSQRTTLRTSTSSSSFLTSSSTSSGPQNR